MTTLPHAAPPKDPPRSPGARPPEGAIDAHVHLLAGKDEFPLWEKRVEDPAPGLSLDDWIAIYRRHLAALGFGRGVLVHSTLYGADTSVTEAALARLGEGFAGVGLAADGAEDAELDRLAEAGFRAIRSNMVHGGVLTWEGAREIAPRLADRGMHLEMLVHADRQIAEMADALRSFPVPVVIDHAGWPADDRNPKGGMAPLIELVADGDVFVKLSGIYRFTEPPWEDAAALVAALAEANPERCVWGSDWPHIMLGGAAQPDAGALLDAFFDAVTGEAARTAILRDTPAALYRL